MAMTDQFQGYGAAMPRRVGLGGGGGLPETVSLSLRLDANWTLGLVLKRFIGAAMMLSAVGLWLMPEAGERYDLTLVRLGISVSLVLVGLALLSVREAAGRPEACFDPIRKELRLLRCDAYRRPRTILRRSYDRLGGARFTAATVQIYEADGSLLMELPICSTALRSQLRDQLSGLVRILS